MAETHETLTPRGALDGYRERFRAIDGPVMIEVPALARHYNLRVDPQGSAIDALWVVLGADLPGPLNWTETPSGDTIVWLGPDEWLLIEGNGSSIDQQALREAVGENGAVVEQSGQRIAITVRGDAPGLLAKGTAFDLHPSRFPRGTALQGFLGQAVVIFLARDDRSSEVELLLRTSFAGYVADWLLDAVADPLAYPA